MPGNRLVDLCGKHGLSRTLAWKILRLANTQDTLASADMVPGPRGMKIFADAAARAGVQPALLASLQTAWDDFHAVAGRHTRSRPQMRSLVAAMSHSGDPSLLHRKAATKANAHIWGNHARVFYLAAWLFDASTSGTPNEKADVILVSGPIGLKSMRPGHPVVITRLRPNALANAASQPLVPRPSGLNLSILPDFSSAPLPAINTTALPDGSMQYDYTPSVLGERGELNLLFGIRIAQGEFHKLPAPEPSIGIHANISRACDLLVLELFLDKTIYPQSRTWSAILDSLQVKSPSRENPLDWLQIPCPLVTHEDSSLAPPNPNVPKHEQLRQFVCETAGVPASRFRHHTFSLPYPPAPSAPAITVDLTNGVP